MTARTVFHGYQLQLDPRGPGDERRSLNRFYAAVEGGAYRVGRTGQFDVVASLRYDVELGSGFAQTTPFGAAIPSTANTVDVDLLYLYVDWRNVIGRWLDLRIGRQLQLDDLDWYVFDGLALKTHLWRDGEDHLDVDIYVGLPVRFDAFFSSSEALLGDGTEVYDGTDPFGGLAVGTAAYLRMFRDLSLSFSWRNELVFRRDELEGFGPAVMVEGPSLGMPLDDDPEARRDLAASASAGTAGLQESLIGGSIGYALRPIDMSVQGRVVFNILTGHLDQARAGLGYDPARNLHFGVEYLRVRPRFVGDSIFNWFNIFGYDRGRVEASWQIFEDRLRMHAFYLLQTFSGDEVGGQVFSGADITHGPGGGLEWREKRYGFGVYGEGATSFGDSAYGGNYALLWVRGDVNFFKGRLVTDARVSLTSVEEDLPEVLGDAARTTVTLAFGVRGHILDWLKARALYVQNIDPVIEGNYRVMTELAVLYP